MHLAYPQCMHHRVTVLALHVFVCAISVCYHSSCYIIYLDLVTWILPKGLRSGDMVVFASLDDCGQLLSTESTPVQLELTSCGVLVTILVAISKQNDSSMSRDLECHDTYNNILRVYSF